MCGCTYRNIPDDVSDCKFVRSEPVYELRYMYKDGVLDDNDWIVYLTMGDGKYDFRTIDYGLVVGVTPTENDFGYVVLREKNPNEYWYEFFVPAYMVGISGESP